MQNNEGVTRDFVYTVQQSQSHGRMIMQHFLKDKEQVQMIFEHNEDFAGQEVMVTDLIVYEHGYSGPGMPGLLWRIAK
jgi:hypothetical protein